MSHPVPVLATMRRLVGPDGFVIVADERVAETFAPPVDDLERFFYGWSITTCLPDGMSQEGSVGTGTVMRPDTLRTATRERRASPTSRCCRSRTTSSASTAWWAEPAF